MTEDFIVLAVIAGCTCLHMELEKLAETHKKNIHHLHWALVPLSQPATLHILKEWAEHLLLFSKAFAIVGG